MEINQVSKAEKSQSPGRLAWATKSVSGHQEPYNEVLALKQKPPTHFGRVPETHLSRRSKAGSRIEQQYSSVSNNGGIKTPRAPPLYNRVDLPRDYYRGWTSGWWSGGYQASLQSAKVPGLGLASTTNPAPTARTRPVGLAALLPLQSGGRRHTPGLRPRSS